jgi:hypothetical protein
MSTPPKIVLLQLISNGDCLYATAVARQIKQDYPGCHLTWAIASFCKTILDNNQYVDAIWAIPDVSKNNCLDVLRRLRKELKQKKLNGEIDEVFFTQIIDENIANYDGCIRSAIFRGYGKPITVPVTPVLRLRTDEIEKVKEFSERHKLEEFKNVILFEFAPQSGQLAMTPSIAIDMANEIVKNKDTAIILSSNIKITEKNKNIIDGSMLTLRETAALTQYCTLLLGCSSGITWISTSEAAKPLPMIQMLDPNACWVNAISRDFERCGLSTENLVEIYEFDAQKIIDCVGIAINTSFADAKKKFYAPLPLQFNTTRRSIYNMLCFLQFKAIIKHIRINVGIYGMHPKLVKAIILAFLTAPFKLIYNAVTKHLLK